MCSKFCIKKKKMDKGEHWGWPMASVTLELVAAENLSLLLFTLFLEREGVIYVVRLISVLQQRFGHQTWLGFV